LLGYSYKYIKPGRNAVGWQKEDSAAVLKKKRLMFMIMGHSQEIVHVMDAKYFYPERFQGIGVNAPSLPSNVSKQEGIVSAIGYIYYQIMRRLRSFIWHGILQ
jgi:hypothetical protein